MGLRPPSAARWWLGRLLGAAGRGGRLILTALLGRVSWTPPRWPGALAARGARRWRAAAARPWRTAGAVAGVLAVAVGLHWGYAWWQARPRPVLVRFSVAAPARTEIESDKAPNPLVVTFERSVAPLALAGKDVDRGVHIAPPLAGTWRWVTDRKLRFSPGEDWPIGADHTVTIGPVALAPDVKLAESHFAFRTPSFTAAVSSAQFHQDPTNAALKKVVVDLRFSHPVDPAGLERRIELRLAGQAPGMLGVGRQATRFTVAYDKLRLNAYVHSEALPVPKEDTELTVTVDRGVAAARGGRASEGPLVQAVAVPGLYSLRVSGIQASVATNAREEPEQVVMIELSATASEREAARGVSAWLLPRHPPGSPVDPRGTPHRWNVSEVTDALLAPAARLALEPVPGEREHVDTHAFRHRADVGRYVYVRVERGLQAFGGYVLGERAHGVVEVPAVPPEVRFLGQGALLALSGERKLAVLARDVPGLRLEIGRVLPGQLQHLVSQSSGQFALPEFLGTFGPDNLTERFERTVALPRRPAGRAHYEAMDLSGYLGAPGAERRGVFLVSVHPWDPRAARPATAPVPRPDESEGEGEPGEPRAAVGGTRADRRLVLVTDLGLLVKTAVDGTQDVFVQSIRTGAPVEGATVEVLARNGLSLAAETTGASGRVTFGKLAGLGRERAPLMHVVRKGGDLSFLPLARPDRGLDYSRFDVGGLRNARVPDQLTAYLFSDRGLYRPGDTLRLGIVVRSAGWAKPLQGLPLEIEILDARGLPIRRERIALGAAGFSELSHATLADAPVGAYAVNLYIVKDGKPDQLLGSTVLRVQEFEPDRMRVSARLSRDAGEGWVTPESLRGRVLVQNLFGTPAEKRRVEATLTLNPAFPAFPSHPDYRFHDPQRAREGYQDRVEDTATDERGEAELDLRLERYARATYRLHLVVRAFEAEGGRSVAAETAVLVSELPFLVGVKADGALDHVSRGSKRAVSVIAIDPGARRVSAGPLRLALVERSFVSVLIRQPNGTYRYESRKKEVELRESALALPAAGLSLPLATDRPGSFAYVIRDAQGLELNRIEYGVAGDANLSRSLDRAAELQLTLSKRDYAPGEEIEVGIRAPYAGAGLITVERDRVYAHRWFRSTTLASVQRIRLPRDFEGNGYVTVQFVRDPASDEIFMSPLSYGVLPFATSLARRTGPLTLDVPARARPGEELRIALRAERPTRAVVFAVDEGILQVARYQSPDPLGHFFRKRALEVRTAQILDLILPEFRKLMAAAAPGGDAEAALGRHLNPFRRKRDAPAVFWSGILDVAGTRELAYPVPDHFSGGLRVMAVAVADDAIGVAQAKTLVRGDFVLSPNLPVAVTPGDEFEVSVGVANLVAGSGPAAAVAVAVTTTEHLAVVGPAGRQVVIGEGREGSAVFRLRAHDGGQGKLGSATVTLTSAVGEHRASVRADLSVRPASPRQTLLAAGSFSGSIEVPVQRDLHAEHRVLEAAVSPVPLVLAGGLARYLATFEHACTEQVLSQAVPLIVLARRPEFGRALEPERGGGGDLERAVRVLRGRQNAEGGFGTWTASVKADEFASVYAVHILLEAREGGAAVPLDMIARGLAYLQQLAASPARSLAEARTRAYAVYLLTRQGMVTSPLLAALRDTLDTRHAKEWPQDLAAGYLAASYQLLKQERQAGELIDGLLARPAQGDGPFHHEAYYDPLVRDAQALYLVARHFRDRARRLPPSALVALVQPIQAGRYHTLSAAYTILALDAYAAAIGPAAAAALEIAEVAADGRARALPLPSHGPPRVPFAAGTARLRFSGAAALTAFYAVTESGFDRVPPAAELRSGFEVFREYLDAAGQPVTSVKLGEEIAVRLRFRLIGRASAPSLALVDLLPGGFEPIVEDRRGPDFVDVREDRVVVYARATRDLGEYRYRIRATNAGRFAVPPIYGESLYDLSLRARSAPGRITVERPER